MELAADIRRLVDQRPTYGYRRQHDGQVIAIRSNIRWCSDALEFTCCNGEVIRVAFALDCMIAR